jgi:hypothetical protein
LVHLEDVILLGKRVRTCPYTKITIVGIELYPKGLHVEMPKSRSRGKRDPFCLLSGIFGWI